jgi:hypothetical protein
MKDSNLGKRSVNKDKREAANTMMGARGRREDSRICIQEAAHVVAEWKLPLTDMPHYVTVIPDRKGILAGGMTDFSHIATREEVKATIKRGSPTRTRKALLAFLRKIAENKANVRRPRRISGANCSGRYSFGLKETV